MGPGNSLFTPIEVAIKVALKQDPATLRRLARLDAKVLQVKIKAPALELFVFPVSDGIEFSSAWEDQIDCTVEGGAADFLEVLLDEQKTFGSGIELSGDSQVAIDLKNCLQKLDIDWEGLLADQIGDLAAHQFAEIFRAGRGYLQKSSDNLLDDLSDYLHEEVRVLPGKVELEQFNQRVDDLRLQVDRLQARVQKLES
ncbi:MAG: SCP2 sterol-binding domain-containing protein [Motiliproteus sp.]|nr:SCP2 sterol-binding domain-containing protein [Motiliproteus sp.]